MRVFNCFRALGLFCLLCMGGNALAGPIKGDHALSFSAGITGTMGDNFVFFDAGQYNTTKVVYIDTTKESVNMDSYNLNGVLALSAGLVDAGSGIGLNLELQYNNMTMSGNRSELSRAITSNAGNIFTSDAWSFLAAVEYRSLITADEDVSTGFYASAGVGIARYFGVGNISFDGEWLHSDSSAAIVALFDAQGKFREYNSNGLMLQGRLGMECLLDSQAPNVTLGLNVAATYIAGLGALAKGSSSTVVNSAGVSYDDPFADNSLVIQLPNLLLFSVELRVSTFY